MYAEVVKDLKILIGIQQKILSQLMSAGLGSLLDQEELLDSTDTKKLLKISDSSLYRLRKNEQVKCKRIAGKWYYFKSSILACGLEQQGQ